MAMFYRPLAFYRETCVFPPVGLEKPLEILKLFLVQVMTLVRPTNTPNLVEIGLQGAPPDSGETSRFCDLFSLFIFFCFLISPTGRNCGPIRTFNCSNDVFCFVHLPFWSLEPSNSFQGVSGRKKHQKVRPVFGLDRFAAEIASALEPSRVKYPQTSR